MTYRISVTMTHKSFESPVIKELIYHGESVGDVVAQLEKGGTPKNHIHNLTHYGKTAFKDGRGVKHKWLIEKIA